MMLSASFIAQLGHGTSALDLPSATGITFHSNRINPGDAFFALPGETTHGIHYANDALSKGASFIVSDKPHAKGVLVNDPVATLLNLGHWARSNLKGTIIGVTGSAGKTSTKAMIASALDMPSSAGNLNTPLALAATMVNTHLANKNDLVLELGIDHMGEMDRLVDLVKPTHGILTLIAPSHLEGLGSVDSVAKEKSKLLLAAATRLAHTQTLPYLQDVTNVQSYGLEHADFTGRYEAGKLLYKNHPIQLPALGEAMAGNAVAALALAEILNLPLDSAICRLEKTQLEPGRLQLIQLGSVTLIDDTYNSSPAAVKEALKVLSTLPAPRTTILGDMLELGTHSADYHFDIGKETRSLDQVIAVGKMAKYIAEANPKAIYFLTIDEALPYLQRLELKGSILVKASRGMKFERCVNALREVLA
jgi:UDP-N-acetylmuramoyl-tripeptide--D-alanyl-D-alanine ligase